MKRNQKLFAFSALLVACTSLIATNYSLRLTNTLESHPDWGSGKLMMKGTGILGAHEFISHRNTLTGNAVDLSKWHGYQEIFYRNTVNLGSASFRFRLEKLAYVAFLFASKEGESFGIRISRNPMYPTALLKIASSGEFLMKKGLPLPEADDAWVDLKIEMRNGSPFLSWNSEPPIQLDITILQPNVVSVRGGMFPALIDRIIITDDSGKKIADEGFENNRGLFIFFAIFAAILAILSWLIPKKFVLKWNALLLIGLCVVSGIDYFFLAGRYPHNLWPSKAGVTALIHAGNLQVAEQFEKLDKSSAFLKVLLVGSSQTWGTGARREEDRLGNALESKLKTLLNQKVIVFNAGVRASNFKEIRTEYERLWASWQPNIVVANIGSNDRTNLTLAEQLTQFIRFNQEHKIQMLFVLEANAPENNQYREGNAALLSRHNEISQIARKNKIPVLDMYKYFSSKQIVDSGFIWWDFVHLTSYGQHLLAVEVAKELSQASNLRIQTSH